MPGRTQATVARPKELATRIERPDGFDLAVVEPEQPANSVAITERGQAPKSQSNVLRMQQAAELHTARQIRGLDPSYAHRAEASKRRPAGTSIGNGVQTTSMQPDILQGALVERMQFP